MPGAGPDRILSWPDQGHVCFRTGPGEGANPNYDVLVAAGTPLAEALASSFGVGGGEVEAFRELEAETESRRETTAEELEGLVSAEDLESQAEMWKAR